MKVLVLGTGAQGSTVARNLDKEPKVSKIICADMDEQQVTSLASSLRSAEGVCVDAENYSEIRKLMESCDLVVMDTVADFLLQNWVIAGRAPLRVAEIDGHDLHIPQAKCQ